MDIETLKTIGAVGGCVTGLAVLFNIFISPIKKDIEHIKKDLSNHITDTNKKIEDLRKEMNSRFDRLEATMIDTLKSLLKK